MKICWYYKFDFITGPDGERFATDDEIKQRHEPILRDLVANYQVDAIKARPRGVKNLDPDFSVWFADLCLELGVELWVHAQGAHNEAGNMMNYPRYAALYDHEAVTRILVDDEVQDVAQLNDAKREYLHLREHTDKPITTVMFGEALQVSGLGDAFDGEYDYRMGINQFVYDYLAPDFQMMRHYPLRRDRGYIDQAYKDKMQLGFVDFLDELRRRDPFSVVVLQAFGKGIEKDKASYWRYPTESELLEMINLAESAGFDWVSLYSVGEPKLDCQLITEALTTPAALDGSTPINCLKRA